MKAWNFINVIEINKIKKNKILMITSAAADDNYANDAFVRITVSVIFFFFSFLFNV